MSLQTTLSSARPAGDSVDTEESAGDGLHARFLRGLALSPQGTAIQVGTRTVTYQAAHDQACAWAGALLTEVRRPGAVAVLAGRSVEAYLGILSCLYAGVTVVPLLTDFPVQRTARMLTAAGVTALLVDSEGEKLLDGLRAEGIDLPVLTTITPAGNHPGWRMIAPDSGTAVTGPRPVYPSDVAYVLFTSGSTGEPKGVRLTHGNMAHYFDLMDRWYGFTSADVFSQAANLNWDSAVSDLWCAWGAGAALVCVQPQHYRAMPEFMAEHRISVWFSAPSAIALVRRMGGLTADSMPSLRWTYFGGEALRFEDTDDWQRAAPNSAVINVYGPTELTITTHRHTWSPGESTAIGINGVVPLGTLHDGHRQLLIDAQGQACDTEGELCIAGPQLSAGYLNPQHGVGRYLLRDGLMFYRTGDLVRRAANGEMIYLGRLDSQVQVNGLRVELAELDHAMRGCAGVQDAVTVGAVVGATNELMVFYTGEFTAPAELARQLMRTVPQQMIPRHYRHVSEFPLNSNKKIDRLRLTETATAFLRGDLP